MIPRARILYNIDRGHHTWRIGISGMSWGTVPRDEQEWLLDLVEQYRSPNHIIQRADVTSRDVVLFITNSPEAVGLFDAYWNDTYGDPRAAVQRWRAKYPHPPLWPDDVPPEDWVL